MEKRLRREHAEIVLLAGRLREGLRSVQPDFELLAGLRWELAKVMMQHLAFEDRNLYQPLERHAEPGVAAVAARFKAALTATQADYDAHTAKWTGPAMKADWRGYCSASTRQLAVLINRVRLEEAELFPLIARLTETGSASPPPTRNWARSALNVHAALAGK